MTDLCHASLKTHKFVDNGEGLCATCGARDPRWKELLLTLETAKKELDERLKGQK